jgi:hypothetical protein
MFKGKIIVYLSILLVEVMGISATQAQSNFLYVQSENNQPYFIQMKGQVYASNAKGYLLVPQMSNGEHTILLGFPGNVYNEYNFSFTIADKPKGYSLKYTTEGEWLLMDMVTLELLRGVVPSSSGLFKKAEPQVKKLSEKITDAGIDQVFSVKNGSQTETVTLFIPALKQTSPDTREAKASPAYKAIHKKTTKQ